MVMYTWKLKYVIVRVIFQKEKSAETHIDRQKKTLKYSVYFNK